ncbi:mucin-2-like isoform X2 [Ostrea edulis]|uniref:mucin-2-like isoform X2 n=1 Tax=Ostrea edulis TaxID=37623 RepID=UPI0024AFB0D7|nr:mucin-2-like isoform X2 [Ostrea edulis]
MTLPMLSSGTVWGVLIITLLSIIPTTEAALGDSCTMVGNCGYNGATCDSGQCGCDTTEGYRVEGNQCLPNVLTVNLAGPSSIVFGQDAVFTASVTSDPEATNIIWQRVSGGATTNITINSTNVVQTGTLPAGSITLTIKSVTFAEGGTYQVMVLNSVDHKTSNQVVLGVTGDAPAVGVSGPTQSGTTVTITCTATVTSDSPAITAIQWTKNSVTIDIAGSNGKYSGGTVSTPPLTITSIAPTDRGDYRCKATNPVGSTTSTSAVTLAPPTVSVTGPSSVLYGNAVTFNGTVTSNLPWIAQKWQKVLNIGTVLDIDISGGKYTGSSLASPNPKLLIIKTDFGDETKYQLVVSNGVGSTTSNQVTLDVTGDAPIVSVTGPTQSDTTVTIGCTAGVTSESPAITAIQWTKDNTTIDIAGSNGKYSGGSVSTPSLTIASIAPTDKGDYRCTATNPVGSTISTSAVTLAPPTVSVTGPSSILYDNAVTFNGTVTSNLPWTAQKWQKVPNIGTVIDIDTSGGKYTGSSLASPNPKLKISNTDSTDEAKYQLVVSNGVGSTTSNQVTLDVTGERPTVSVSGPTQSGTTVTIVCTATVTSESPAITAIQWTKNSVAIDIAGSNGKYSGGSISIPSLTITTITSTDRGDYRCKATNAVGSTNSTSAVTLAPPTTVSVTGPSSVLYGNDVTFTGTVTSDLSWTAQKWQKVYSNGTVLDININDGKYAGSSLASPNPKLQIIKTDFGDETKYQLVVSNGVGSTTSNQVTLDVTGDIPTVALTGGSTVVFGSDITFTGTITSSPATTSVTWQKVNGSQTENLDISNQKYAGSSVIVGSTKLVINDAKFNDDAIYQLAVTNLVGKKTSNKINLTVTGEKPTITINPASATVFVVYGKTATLTATVTTTPDSPPAAVNGSWQKQMSGVFTDIDISDEKYKDSVNDVSVPVLKINSAVYTDEGAYRFTANNLVGTTVSSAKTLDVTGKPNKIARVKRAANSTSTSASSISSTSSTYVTTTMTTTTAASPSQPTVTISANPSSTIQFGTTLNITATVTANPPANTTRWQRKPQNGAWSDINISDPMYNGSSDTPGAPLLVISSITYSVDNTMFQCVVGNVEGETTSNEITIDVTGNLLSVSITPSGPALLPHGTTLMPALVATVTAGSNTEPAQEVRWRKITSGNIETINISSSKYSGSTDVLSNPQLVINNAIFGDEAEYQCQARNTEGWGPSNKVSIDVTGGVLTVTIGSDVEGKIGESATISCTVRGPEINKITWRKAGADITIDGAKYTGSTPNSHSLTINDLVTQDADQYQCTATNPGGTYASPGSATLTVINRQFQDVCNASLPCDDSKELECSQSTGRCVCKGTFYHNNNLCHSRDRLKATFTSHSSSTSAFSVTWNDPSNDVNLVSGYIVRWRIHDQIESTQQLQTVDKSVTSHTVSTGLIRGQLYIVAVTSSVTLTNPASNIEVHSDLEYIRIVPLPPGSILDSSDLASDKLMLSWTLPINGTVVTNYDVTINGTTQSTVNSNANILFTKQLIPGTKYNVSIVTVSGQNMNNNEEKRSVAYTEEIRTTPTRPDPPTGVTCPGEPKDKSLEISWTAPTAPNGRIVKYIILVSGEVTNTVDTLSNVNTFDVTGLLEERSYTFAVKTVNDAVNSTSIESAPVTCQTKAELSTPPTALTIRTPTSRGFPVSFSHPTDVKGKLAGYRILISDGSKCWQQIKIICNSCAEFTNASQSCDTSIVHRVPDINVTQNYDVTGLHPYINYTVEVAAINGAGVGNSVDNTTMTEEEVPQKPSISSVKPKSDKEVDLTWSLASPSPGNVTYTVTVMEAEDNTSDVYINKREIQYSGFQHTVKLIDGLEEFWRYKFTVKAATIKGFKTSEESTVIRTNQGVPGKVRDLTVVRKPNTYRAALVQWKVPLLRDQNGILVNYKFISNATGSTDKLVPVDTSEQFVTEEEIVVVPEMTYSIEIYAINSEDTIGEKETSVYSAEAGPPPKPPVESIVSTTPGQHSPSQTTIEIGINTDFFTDNNNGEPTYFGIAVCASCGNANFAGNGQQEYKDLPSWSAARTQGFPLYRVTNETYMEEVKNSTSASGRRKRSTEVPFIIGEDNTCESQGSTAYCNGPLSPGLSYTVVIFVCTNGGCTQSDDIGPFATLKVPEDPFPIGGVVGGVVAAVVVVFVIAVAMFIVKRRRGRNPEHKYQKNIEERGDDLSETHTLKNIPRKRPIKLKDLADKVADKHKDSNLHFAKEYEDLKTLSPKHGTETSELDNNKLKNRYVNILPFDHSRVKLLLTEDDDPSTDFINANYLPGYKSEREYIATQGPIPGTIDDFWRMIWEQNVSIIVMLTLCKEDGRVKCEMYWPENMKEPKQYGDLVVETVSCSTVNFYDFRIFKMKLGDSTRTLKHFHFLQWKDFSANVQNDVMIDFIRNVRNHIRPPDMNGPVVVHCSAGVGRTGTYCALDHLFQVIDDHDLDHSIDIFDLVLNLREQRMFMVQTEQQYIFIHDCLKEFLDKKRKELEGGEECLYENQAFVADEPPEESLYQNYSNQRTDL